VRFTLRGSGGLGALQIEGQLDTNDLSPDLARRAETSLRPKQLQMIKKLELANMTDPEEFYLVVFEDGQSHEFHFQSSNTPIEITNLLGELMHEVIVRKAKVKK
jgi:hypothetical protein